MLRRKRESQHHVSDCKLGKDLLVATSGARAASAACGGLRFACNTAATFCVFYWRQVTKWDVLLNSAPSGPDYIDILGFCLHRRLFRSSVRFRMAD